jgi:hypothetical protein
MVLRKRKKQDVENYIMRTLIIFTLKKYPYIDEVTGNKLSQLMYPAWWK